MITLMYIVGISRTDTPIFNNVISQQEWFNTNAENVRKVDTIFPPYHTNRIRLSDDDINFDSTYNYLILTFRNVNYYYFIKDFNYVNEGLIDIDIEMDTIQTFIFNIIYHNARINRRTIKRYTDKTRTRINRNYIRENYSNNIFKNNKYINYTKDFTDKYHFNGFIFIHYTDEAIGDFTAPSTVYDIDNNILYNSNNRVKMLPSSIFTYIPTGRMDYKIKYYTNNGTVEEKSITDRQIAHAINKYSFDNTVYKITYIPNNPFIDCLFSLTNNTLTMDFTPNNRNKFEYEVVVGNDELSFKVLYYANKSFYKDEDLGFHDHAILGEPFDKQYIPQLIDENYIKVYFGEYSDYTEAPISKYETSEIRLMTKYDIYNGYRFYWFLSILDDEDYYNTKICIDNEISINLYNDYFKQYMSGNSGSMLINTSISAIVSALTSNPSLLMSSVLDDTTKVANAIIKPNTIKNLGNLSSSIVSKNSDMIYKTEMCTNIDTVATIYESIGYLVDEYVIGSPIFNDRQIYNYVQCKEIDLSLVNTISSGEIIDDIHKRFIDGLRFWNTETMKTLRDNAHPIDLGDVCIYDNVEVW